MCYKYIFKFLVPKKSEEPGDFKSKMKNIKFESLSDNNDDGHIETIGDAIKI